MHRKATIEALKAQAKAHYLAYLEAVDGLDCGAQMAQMLKPDAATHARNFDEIAGKLRALDPKCPPILKLSAPS